MTLSLKRLMLKEEGEKGAEAVTSRPDSESSVDRQIFKVILDAERSAVKAGKDQASITAMESVRRGSLRYLIEADETNKPPIDVGIFAMEIMRVVKNFDTLLDIPTVIVNRAYEYLNSRYDKKIADSFVSSLRDEFNFVPGSNKGSRTTGPDESEIIGNIGVGAMSSAGA